MNDFFKKFEDTKSELEKQEEEQKDLEMIIEVDDKPKIKQAAEMMIAGENIDVIIKSDSNKSLKYTEGIFPRLGYMKSCVSIFEGKVKASYKKTQCSSEYILIRNVEKMYDEIIDKLFEKESMRSEHVYLFMALVKNKKMPITSEEINYIGKIVSNQNGLTDRNGYKLTLCKDMIEQINDFVKQKNLQFDEAKYDCGTRKNDFNMNSEEIEEDAKNRADLLIKLLLNDPLRGRSRLNEAGYDLVIAATAHHGRWYNLRRDPLVHYHVLRNYPEDMKIKRDFVNEILSSVKEEHAGSSLIMLAGLIDRAYRVEKERGPLIF